MKLQVSSADYRKLSDQELVHRYVSRKDHVTINVLFERYGHLVLGVCIKYLKNNEAAKDATQQIFIKLLEDLHRFQIENFKSWLLQVTRNHCLMQLRKGVKLVNKDWEQGEDIESDEGWQQKIEDEKLYEQLELAIAQLNKEQRTCIELFYLKKMTYGEIASATKYTATQVKSYIQNGKRNLKIKLEALTGGVRQ
jgi:RNA polymerase sigma factor (sigma-70 family)